jgi:uncharacterized protein
MTLDELRQNNRSEILRLAQRHGASNVRVFGSLARGSATMASDVDFLVDFAEGRSLLDQIALQQELKSLLGCDVDLVEPGGVSPYLAKGILAEAVPL